MYKPQVIPILAFLLLTMSCEDENRLPASQSLLAASFPSKQLDTFSTDSATTDRIVVETPQQVAHKAQAHQEGILKAEADRKLGIIGYWFGGFGIPSYADTLETKYGMKVYRSGCVLGKDEFTMWESYNRYMDSVILTVYHIDLIAREKSRVQQYFLRKRKL